MKKIIISIILVVALMATSAIGLVSCESDWDRVRNGTWENEQLEFYFGNDPGGQWRVVGNDEAVRFSYTMRGGVMQLQIENSDGYIDFRDESIVIFEYRFRGRDTLILDMSSLGDELTEGVVLTRRRP